MQTKVSLYSLVGGDLLRPIIWPCYLRSNLMGQTRCLLLTEAGPPRGYEWHYQSIQERRLRTEREATRRFFALNTRTNRGVY